MNDRIRATRTLAVALLTVAMLLANAPSAAALRTPAEDTQWATRSLLVPSSGPTLADMGDIDGNYAAWTTTSDFGSTYQLTVRDLGESSTFQPDDGSLSQRNPSISEGTLVCDEVFAAGVRKVVLWDLYLNSSREIATTTIFGYPSISGDYVAFTMQSGPASQDIYLYDIAEGSTTQVTSTGRADSARVWGPYIAYFNATPTSNQIRLYDIRDNTDRLVAESTTIGDRLDFDEGIIAYTYSTLSDSTNVAAYDVQTEVTVDVDPTTLAETDPRVCGRQIIFQRASTIYAFDLGSAVSNNVVPENSIPIAADAERFLYHETSTNQCMLADFQRPDITIGRSFSGAYNAVAQLNGRMGDRGAQLNGQPLRVEYSTDLIEWYPVDTVHTSWGWWSASSDPVWRLTFFRVVYDGDFSDFPGHLSGVSPIVTAFPKARVGSPGVPSRMRLNRTYTIRGSISPSQYGEDATGYLEMSRKYRGHWVGRRVLSVTFPAGGGYLRSFKLTARGTWRVRMVFTGSDINQSASTSWRTTTVY